MKLVKHNISVLFLSSIFISLFGQTGPGGVGMNDGSSALKLWLDANKELYQDTVQNRTAEGGTRVMMWKDLSGSHNDVVAQTDSNSPTLVMASPLLNGQNAVRFFRDQNTMNRRNYLVSKSFSKTNDITIYCVFHALSKAGGNGMTPLQAKKYDNNMWYGGAGLVDGGAPGLVNDVSLAFCDTSIAAGVGDSTTGTDYCVKTPVSLYKTYFSCLEKEAWTGKLNIGQNNSTRVFYQAGAQPINNSERYFIGSNSDLSQGKTSPFFDGYIASVLVYNRLLNAAERIILENYLSAKYDLPLNSNDLYKFDEPTSGNFDFDLIGIGKAVDGTFQLSAKGEGMLELRNADELDKGEFVFIGHDGKSFGSFTNDIPEGIQFRLGRTWVYSKNGATQKVDLSIDAKEISTIDPHNITLLIDTDNDGSFADEKIGEGILVHPELTSQGPIVFCGIPLLHGNRFTFAQIKPQCQSNCETYFSPDGDGITDVYYLEDSGKTSIYDRSGKLVKSIATPAYWDGTNEKGEPSAPGIYFLIANEGHQETVTLIR